MAGETIKRPIGGNSSLRTIGSALMHKPTEWLVKKFPKITADGVTITGLGLTLAGSALKAIPERMTFGGNTSLVALGMMSAGAILDGLDGQVARAKGESSINGVITDVLSDRVGESGMAVSRIIQAAARKDPVGVVAATFAGITGPLPSLYRAKVEGKGFFVPESGKNPASFLGARLARVISGTAATTYPTAFDFPAQKVLDTISGLSNGLLFLERLNILEQANNGEFKINPDEKVKELGYKKAEVLSKFFIANGVGLLAIGAAALLNSLILKSRRQFAQSRFLIFGFNHRRSQNNAGSP